MCLEQASINSFTDILPIFYVNDIWYAATKEGLVKIRQTSALPFLSYPKFARFLFLFTSMLHGITPRQVTEQLADFYPIYLKHIQTCEFHWEDFQTFTEPFSVITILLYEQYYRKVYQL